MEERCFLQSSQTATRRKRCAWSIGAMIQTANAEVLRDTPVPVALCPPQSSRGMNCNGTRASLVKDRLLND